MLLRNFVSYIKGNSGLRGFDSRGLRKIFRPEREEVAGGWRQIARFRVSSFALLTKFYSGDKIEDNEMGGTCGTFREE